MTIDELRRVVMADVTERQNVTRLLRALDLAIAAKLAYETGRSSRMSAALAAFDRALGAEE